MILAVEEMAEGYEMLTGNSPWELTFIHKVVDAGKNHVARVSRSFLNTELLPQLP